MKHYILKQVVNYLQDYKTIKYIKRVQNNTILIEFNGKNQIYFDLTKGDSSIYKNDEKENRKKDFTAPFDIILQKNFTNSSIEKVELLNDDKIIRFTINSKSKYKTQKLYIQLEYTGKYTNAIILDQDEKIVEALRHIDEWSSTRVVKVGQKLQVLEKPNFNYEVKEIEDIETYLYEVYSKKQTNLLNQVKKLKLKLIDENQKKIQKILDKLDDIDTLQNQSVKANQDGSLILNELYKYSGYEKNIMIKRSNDLFKKSKKLKQKVKNQYLEERNLTLKLNYFQKLKSIIQDANSIDEVEYYLPKKEKNQIKTKKATPYQEFFCDGFKIMLGRDERENIFLLQNSKASDFWFHLQGQVSSHVIVSNTKKTLPEHIIEEAAKICAKFSVSSGGVYSVDFTQRRNIKIQTRANVLYNPYSTVVVKI